jgi:hypothetical protein
MTRHERRSEEPGRQSGTAAVFLVGLVLAALLAFLVGQAHASGDSRGREWSPPNTAPSAPSVADRHGARAPKGTSAPWYLTQPEIVQIRRNISTKRWAKIAWQKTKGLADAALGQIPHPADPKGDYRERGDSACTDSSGWFCGLYLPGLNDGRATLALALAYAVTGRRAYAERAKDFLLAWAGNYNPPPPTSLIGHMVAEPVGFMLKGFMAYDLVKGVFSQSDQTKFRAWAGIFVGRGERLADYSRDRPWVPQAPYGNSATWSRALAVLAAAVLGGRTLGQTLDWNWSHRTPGGSNYGWNVLLDSAMHEDGKMVEEDVRRSIFYGLFTLHPLMLIAAVASHTAYKHDLWRSAVPAGKGVYRAIVYYAPYLTNSREWPTGYTEPSGRSHDSVTSEYRAVMETAANFLPKSSLLHKVVEFGGDQVRGSNDDPHITGFNALTGGLGVGPTGRSRLKVRAPEPTQR